MKEIFVYNIHELDVIFLNFHLITLGCKVNQYETQAIKEALIKLGHTADTATSADAVIINSCTVTAESDRKTRQLLRRAKNSNPGAIMVLTGCMVQAFPEKAKLLKEADIIIGNRDTSKIIKAIIDYKNQKHFEVTPHNNGDNYCGLQIISGFSERTRAYIKIEDGCNRYCSYCIIPKARGFVRSRELEEIKSEAKSLADSGYTEIVLVGINLSAYGQGTALNICDAVDAVAEIGVIKRVRLGSLEPDHITDGMLKRLSQNKKFCPQFHLSLQSGCDDTLKRMNRHYDTSFYFDLIKRIRTIFTNAAITTDIMVGFPGETEKEFNESLAFVNKAGFARAHIFAYSRRPGTVADALPNQITNSEKQRRAKIMAIAAAKSEKDFLKSQVSMTFPVLFETYKGTTQEGYTPNYTRVRVLSDENLTGQILNVRITEAKEDYCIGKI